MVEAVFDEERFLGVLLTTAMWEVKLWNEAREGNERTSASFSFSYAGVAVKRPSSPASTRSGTYSTA